ATRRPNKDLLRFSPNFTAYVLPQEVVCLYSEDRKFFLHGELYCALAGAIGKNGKSAPDLIRELSKTFAREKIEEGIKRLIERRYVVPALTSCDSTVAGYWASLRLPAEIEEQNRGNCRVRLEAIDVRRSPELISVVTARGVNVGC